MNNDIQFWVAIGTVIGSVGAVIWRMSSGFAGVRKDITWMKDTNDREHTVINKRLDAHSDKIDTVAARLNRIGGK